MLVLLVEDEPLVRMMAVDMLEDAGFSVVAAATADEAWTILESRNDIGVLFTDIAMPGLMDGYSLAARVAVHWPTIQLVLTSGRNCLSPSDVPDDGEFVSKPYFAQEVLRAFASAGGA